MKLTIMDDEQKPKKISGLKCPHCQGDEWLHIRTDGTIRRRECAGCGQRCRTREAVVAVIRRRNAPGSN
jgi:uncharacterized metal-binding protein (TIGR02443 family)